MRNRFLLYTMLCVGLCFTWVGTAWSQNKSYLQAGYGFSIPHLHNNDPLAGRQYQYGDYWVIALGKYKKRGTSFSVEVAYANWTYKYNEPFLKGFENKRNRLNQYSSKLMWNKKLVQTKRMDFGVGLGLHHERNYLSEATAAVVPGVLDVSYTNAGLIGRLTSALKIRNAELEFQAQMYWLYAYKKPGFILNPTLKVPF